MTNQKVKVVFQPSGRQGQIEKGDTLLEASKKLGVDIESLCGGKQLCGKCKVKIVEGRFEKLGIESSMAHLTEWLPSEEKFIDEKARSESYRLACAARLKGDILVFVPEKSQASKQVVRKAAREIPIKVNPAAKLYYVELTEPSLTDPLGDYERLAQELEETWGLKNLSIDYFTLIDLPRILREAGWKITVTVWHGREIIRVQPGRVDESLGLAVDVGTTTVGAYLCSLKTGEVHATESMMNPQVSYGEDVMSRITYAMDHPDSGLEKMNRLIINGLNEMIEKVSEATGTSRDNIVDMTLVGNTAMHHILLRINPQYIGTSPFAPALHNSIDIKARDLGIAINKSSYVHILPIEAGFVGADNVGVLLCEEPYKKDEIQLIIDIGTNGELVLGNKERIISSSCATGPAFEGAQIAFGMRAAPGAIERVRIDPETFEINYKVIGFESWSQYAPAEDMKTKGICGSGIIDLLGELYRAGIVQDNGNFKKNLNIPRLRSDGNGKFEFVIAWKEETSIDKDIVITQADIRQIQLAKAAIYAGAKLMMRRLGIDRVDRVVIAGAFGTYIDKEEALTIGMIPNISSDRIVAVGNAAGDGARVALLNKGKREEAKRIARKVEYIELTIAEGFQDEFVAALHIPHARDSLTNALRSYVKDTSAYQ